MQTLTIEHSNSWGYGKNFFFVDLYDADFNSGKKHTLYAQWAPKLSLSNITQIPIKFGIINDIYLAGEVNQGDGFQALNAGVALGLILPTFTYFDVNLFLRNDSYNKPNYQVTLSWESRFSIFGAPFVFEGFLDHYGTDYGSSTVSQPHLLYELSAINSQVDNIQIGTELYYYRTSKSDYSPRVDELIPQFLVKWIF